MARKKRASGETVSGYFTKVFAKHPDWLEERSNKLLFQRWLDDHPGQKEVPLSVKQGLSNIKSNLRKKGTKRKKRGRPAAAANGVAAKPIRIAASVLEKLEFQID